MKKETKRGMLSKTFEAVGLASLAVIGLGSATTTTTKTMQAQEVAKTSKTIQVNAQIQTQTPAKSTGETQSIKINTLPPHNSFSGIAKPWKTLSRYKQQKQAKKYCQPKKRK
jgi:hypothetical protein